jgi:flagellar protein FliO/FliZ
VTPLGHYVVETLVMLTGVVALVVLLLSVGRRFGLGRQSGPLELVGRLPLDARRAVYLVRVGETVYVVGASESGLNKLGELPKEGVEMPKGQAPDTAFRGVLERVLGRATPPAGGSPTG